MKKISYSSLLKAVPIVFWLSMMLVVASHAEMTASLAWSDADGRQEQIYFSRYADGAWQNPVQLTESDNLDYLPSSGTGDDDSTWVVWSSLQGNLILLMYTVDSGSGWSEPAIIETGMSSNTAVSLVVDQQNVPWIVWAGFDGNDDEIFWSRWEDGQWVNPERVTAANDVPDLLPLLSMDAQGVMNVRWQGFDGEKYATVSRSFIDGSWQEGQGPERKVALQAKGEKDGVLYPQFPDFVTDPAKAKIHVIRK